MIAITPRAPFSHSTVYILAPGKFVPKRNRGKEKWEEKNQITLETLNAYSKIELKKKDEKKENLNLQKLPEVPDRKKGWRMRKRKKASSWERGTGYLSLSGGD